MTSTIVVFSLAAGVMAGSFHEAPPFTCPSNTDNACTEQQRSGFGFGDLPLGKFTQYMGFSFRGFSCASGIGKRFASTTNGSSYIHGTCGPELETSPSFGCAVGTTPDRFSLASIHVRPEFDCDLEFHYGMPDGSTCKHRNLCQKSGTTVDNSQCGGAKNVTIVYPVQVNKPMPSCSIVIPTISLDCNAASRSSKTASVTFTSVQTEEGSLTSSTKSFATYTGTGANTPLPVPTSLPSSLMHTTSGPLVLPSQPVGSSTVPVSSTSLGDSSASSASLWSTLTSTVASCASAAASDCPADSATTLIVAVSTTICPASSEITSRGTTILLSASSESGAARGSSAFSRGSSSLSAATTLAASPVETLPYPNVVPSCLNTFLFSVNCRDNSDSACYCPERSFVKSVFGCIYAHGASDDIVLEGVLFFQGICAPFVESNPGIVADATVTSYISAATALPASVAPIYTTIAALITTVVPYTDYGPARIPISSSTTSVMSITLKVPLVDFHTGAAGAVGVIPVTAQPSAVVSDHTTSGFYPKPTSSGPVQALPLAAISYVRSTNKRRT
ncbi:adhesin protein Mad1 [Podospora didyma]|uniref:Adhesin protein Mad1 n=1 Tax=Podospora didyma TaxID=330526 RepID=A0AAE0JYR8_9PEZI|nr:adhesin protein Mad1 [Podospora didyma]